MIDTTVQDIKSASRIDQLVLRTKVNIVNSFQVTLREQYRSGVTMTFDYAGAEQLGKEIALGEIPRRATNSHGSHTYHHSLLT